MLCWSPIEGQLGHILPLDIAQVRRSGDEALFDSLVETYHYLGYTRPVGEHLKYLVSAKGVPVACLAWSSAPRHIGCRDRFIGWSPETCRKNIRFIAYNLRYLILLWVQVPHPASHLLGRMARMLSNDWGRIYGPRSSSWRPSWIRSVSTAPATGPPPGSAWAARLGAGRMTWPTGPTRPEPVKRWAIRLCGMLVHSSFLPAFHRVFP